MCVALLVKMREPWADEFIAIRKTQFMYKMIKAISMC